MRDKQRQTNEHVKIELLSQWKLEAEFRNILGILHMLVTERYNDILPVAKWALTT